jgi:hypothetical protein
MIDVIDNCVKECSLASSAHNGLEACLVNNAFTNLTGDAQVNAKLLAKNPPIKDLGIEDLFEENFDPL